MNCMHCGEQVSSTGSMEWWCSLPCKGHVLEKYNEAQRFKFDPEHNEYLQWLKTLDKKQIFTNADLTSPKEYIRREAIQYFKHIKER